MEHSARSVEPSEIHLLNRTAARISRVRAARPGVHTLRGRAAIAEQVEMLKALCERTGQAGAMHWLESAMCKPTEAKKVPTLLLIGRNGNEAVAGGSADDVLGAVMLYEYKFAGFGLRLFATDDMNGLSTVIAPAAARIEIAEAACAELMEQGALAAVISLSPGANDEAGEWVRGRRAGTFARARRLRSVPLGLWLKDGYHETLAGLGRHTRRNLRYYRRRLEQDMGSEFVPRVSMSRDDFLALNQASMNPASEAWARWRYDSAENGDGMMFAGMRARDGQWLSLIGGRRFGETVYIDWQMNLEGLSRYSLSTVMRSYTLEHETALGTKNMVFAGGTPHSMRHSFMCVDVMDVVGLRRSFAGRLLRALARWVLPGNFLGQALGDEKLQWE